MMAAFFYVNRPYRLNIERLIAPQLRSKNQAQKNQSLIGIGLRLFVQPPLPLHYKKVLNHHFNKWVFAIMFLHVPHVI